MNFIKKLGSRGESSLTQTLLVSALIIAAFFIGMLWTKVQSLEGTSKAPAGRDLGAGVGQYEDPNAYNAPSGPRDIDAIADDDWVRGNRNARFALIEYSDPECPFCKQFHSTAQQMVAAYGDQVMWVYRHFPLTQLHAKARTESIAMQCAGILGGEGKFWEYADVLYANTPSNDGLELSQLENFAAQVGLNASQFKTCRDSEEAAAAVDADYESAFRAQINGTPGNFLYDTQTGNFVELAGAVPYTQLKAELDRFIANADK